MKRTIRVAFVLAALFAPAVLAQSKYPPPKMYFDDASSVPSVDPTCLVSSNGSGLPSSPPAHGSLRNTCTSLLRGRIGQASVALGDSQVLIAGGLSDRAPGTQDILNCLLKNFAAGCMQVPMPIALNEAELYDPRLGVFVPAASMQVARANAASVRLANGQVLLVGGLGAYDGADPGATAELYAPAANRFSATAGPPVVRRNGGASATLLKDGRVLIAGGSGCYWKRVAPTLAYLDCFPYYNEAELYDPATGRFTATGSMSVIRSGHSAVRLASGKVLVVGGDGLNGTGTSSAELYDPLTGSFSPLGNLPAYASTAAALPDGRVLIVGSYPPAAWIYDPAAGSITTIPGPELGSGPALPLADGRILLAPFTCNRPQVYDPATGKFTVQGTNLVAVGNPYYYDCAGGVSVLQNGQVLLTGGSNVVNMLGSFSYTEYFKQAQLFMP